MNKIKNSSFTFIEKIFGLIIAIIGILLMYYTCANLVAAGMAAYVFVALGMFLVILGLVMIISRAE